MAKELWPGVGAVAGTLQFVQADGTIGVIYGKVWVDATAVEAAVDTERQHHAAQLAEKDEQIADLNDRLRRYATASYLRHLDGSGV